MDDPISALDANVKKKIFQNVLLDHLKDKTRILVTHAVDFLHLVDRVLVVKDGELVLDGNYQDIKDDEYLQELISIHKSNQTKKTEDDVEGDEGITEGAAGGDGEESDVSVDSKDDRKDEGKMMVKEQDEVIEITFGSYYRYFMHYWNGCVFFTLGNLSMICFMICWMSGDYLVGNWALQPDQHKNFNYYCGLSFAFSFATSFFVICRVMVMLYHCWRASKILHAEMINRIVYAPINLYFDVTPIGKSMNKFSKDLSTLETSFGYAIGNVLGMAYILL